MGISCHSISWMLWLYRGRLIIECIIFVSSFLLLTGCACNRLASAEERGARIKGAVTQDQSHAQVQRSEPSMARTHPFICAGAVALVVMGVLGDRIISPDCQFEDIGRALVLPAALHAYNHVLATEKVQRTLVQASDKYMITFEILVNIYHRAMCRLQKQNILRWKPMCADVPKLLNTTLF